MSVWNRLQEEWLRAREWFSQPVPVVRPGMGPKCRLATVGGITSCGQCGRKWSPSEGLDAKCGAP